ncbi:MAG: phosphoserine phosphatase SerB [Pseudomonadota bacterium]
MGSVVTLIAGPDAGPSLAALAETLGNRLGAGPPDWLGPGEALDLAFDGVAAEEARALCREAVGEAPVDWLVQPAAGRRKAVLVADMESTIIGQEMLDELAEAVDARAKVEDITARAMAGELDFEAALAERVELLAGLPESLLDQVAGRMTLNPGARTLVRTLAANGVRTALVSGGFTCFADQVAEACGFHEVQANRLEVEDGHLNGQVVPPVIGAAGKLDALQRLAAERGVALEECCTLGDGANDAPMLAAAGLGIAYRGKPPAREAAKINLAHGDLTAVLYLQGFRREEFVS